MFDPEVQIIHANMKSAIFALNVQNSCVLWEIGVGEHDGDVRFLTGSRNMVVSRMRNEKICNLAFTCRQIAYELGYGADTMFHRTYFLFCSKFSWLEMPLTSTKQREICRG